MKRFCILFAALFFFSVILPGFVGAQAKVITLNYAHFMPIVTEQAKLAKQWCDEVEKRTRGKVKITFFPGGTLATAPMIYDGVVKGIADIGWSYFALNKGKFPLIEVVDLPHGYRSGYVATKLINEVYKKYQPKELNDVKVLYLHAHGPGLLITKKPVRNLDELKGMKIRSTGISSQLTSYLGAAPVGMPIAEAYDALMKGVCEGILTPVEALKQWKFAEVTKFVTENYGTAYTTGFYAIMNKKKWDSLPADVKQVIQELNEEWIEKTGRLWDRMDKEGKEFAMAKGIKFVSLTPQEDAKWAEKARPMFDDYVKKMKDKKLPGDEVLRFAQDYLKKHQK